jgi:predicted Zn-dependent protease
LQRLVDELRERLGIPEPVTVSVVANNPKVVSVAPPAGRGLPFELAVEADFLAALADDELTAALAHELGHVWVSTHHPFLQTERLANDIAMRVVSRDSLERVYTKMWTRMGANADLVTFLGPTLVATSTQALPAD